MDKIKVINNFLAYVNNIMCIGCALGFDAFSDTVIKIRKEAARIAQGGFFKKNFYLIK